MTAGGRKPTQSDLAAIRRLVERAGGAEGFRQWLRAACPPRPRGRPKESSRFADYDDLVLSIAYDALNRYRNLELRPLLRRIISSPKVPAAYADEHERDRVIHRLEEKYRRDTEETARASEWEKARLVDELVRVIETVEPLSDEDKTRMLEQLLARLQGGSLRRN